jgi:AcrR family transcriptional regulator
MPRIAQRRPTAVPTTSGQEARRDAILAAAAGLGDTKEIDRIGAQEIAAQAGVALRTLYRYYPTKHHVFAGLLNARIARLRVPASRSGDPALAVAGFMADACRNTLRHRHLAHAMITSTQVVRTQSGPTGYHAMRDLILQVAGVNHPSAEQIRLARLVEQVTFGVLTWAVGGEIDAEQAADDVREACRLLLSGAF